MATQEKDTVREGKNNKNPMQSTQVHMRVAEIRDNTLVLKNGGLRAILRVTPVNFNLKSEPEQNALIYGYQSFLNTLEFPVQVVVRSKKIDIDNYITQLKGVADKQTNPLLHGQTLEYIDFISRLVEYADIMEKDFLVVVPYNPARAQEMSFFEKLMSHFRGKDSYAQIKQRNAEFDRLKKSLTERTQVIQNGLTNVGLKVEELNTQQLVEMFYGIYNPITSRNEKIEKLDQTTIQEDKVA